MNMREANPDGRLMRHWHYLPRDEVVTLLGTDAAKGLDPGEAQDRRSRYGPNRLTPKKGKSPALLFLQQFHQPLVYILLGASLVTALLQEWIDSSVILGVVLVNAVIGFIQERKALKAIEALARSMEGEATVVRAGQKSRINAAELVPGDLVILKSGDKVPADLRLLHTRELRIDESALTGESLPTHKQTERLAEQTGIGDRSNMAYSSTLVTYGSGAGIVTGTGDQTEIGAINALIASAVSLATPLTRKIAQFSAILLWLILALAGLTLVAGWLHGTPWLESFMAAVALAVGAIPEGLPAAMTIMLALGVGKMAQRNAIIRKMPAVETLGSTTVICSDKTGTLTQNQMTVRQLYAGGSSFQVEGVGYAPQGRILRDGVSISPAAFPSLLRCLQTGLLCNDSRLVLHGRLWHVEGDPTEGALITAGLKASLQQDSLDARYPRVDTLPFESQHQYMATLHQPPDSAQPLVLVKGAVESLLSRCRASLDADGQEVALDTGAIERQVVELAEQGLRVLAFACKSLPAGETTISHEAIASGLTFIGLQAMLDPPREEAISAVAACQSAGIKVKMITGDHLATAAAIARQIGLTETDDQPLETFAISGQTLVSLEKDRLAEVADRAAVFARVSPEQKLRLVEALQSRGHVVAMTGDGVNDAPALKQADIGVAMGVAGTEVAKEAADMVLTDDNFATIQAAVEEGRAVFDNLVKFITWTLPTNMGEGLVILVAVFAGITLPITPVQILWINMSTAVLLGLMLAFEGREPGLMARPPRRPDTPVLTRELALRMGVVSLLLVLGAFWAFEWVLGLGRPIEAARTAAVNVFVFGELFYLLNCRSLRYSMFRLGVFSNRWLVVGVLAMTLLQLFFTYSPTMNLLFGSAPLGAVVWIWILGSGGLIYALVGLEKWLRYGRVASRGR